MRETGGHVKLGGSLRDRLLITGRGGATKRERGQVKFYPYKMGGGGREGKVLAVLKEGAGGGGTKR